MRFYLAGPVGYGKPGREWKSGLVSLLRDFGHEVYDPIENDHKYPDIPKLNVMKSTAKNNHLEIKRIMEEIFIDDCQFITSADYIICYFTGRALGTSSEQGISYYLNKFLGKKIKIISVFDEDFEPDEWTLCCSDHIFFSLADCTNFLKGVA